MSVTTERILIVILLIVAVLFATRDAHAGIIVKCDSVDMDARQHKTTSAALMWDGLGYLYDSYTKYSL